MLERNLEGRRKMQKLRIAAVVGARPNFMKVAPLLWAAGKRPERFEFRLPPRAVTARADGRATPWPGDPSFATANRAGIVCHGFQSR